MAELFAVRLDEAIREVERELYIRQQFYPVRVREGKMSRIIANTQTRRLEAASRFLHEFRAIKGGDYEGDTRDAGGALAR